MNLQLEGKLALVTGSTSGIGKAIARSLLREGVIVVINSFSNDEIDMVREELNELGDARFMVCDMTCTESVNTMMRNIHNIGPLDILINNVGMWEDCKFEEISDLQWQRMFDINFFPSVRTLRYCLPKMLKRKYGRVLNVASEVAFKPSASCIHYCSAKTAVVSLSRGLAECTRNTDVTINSLIFGPTWTPGEAAFIKRAADEAGRDLESYLSEFFKNNEPTSIAQRYLTVDEIANTVTYYCSPLASAVNGVSIRIDGGIIRHI